MADLVIERFGGGYRATDDFFGERTAVRTWDVYLDNPTDDEDAAVAAVSTYEGGLSFTTSHPRVSGIVAKNLEVDRNDDTGAHWTVVWEYTNQFNPADNPNPGGGTSGGGNNFTDPTEFEAKAWWSFEDFNEPVENALLVTDEAADPPTLEETESPPLNSAGDIFDPQPTEESSRAVFVCERNEYTATPTVDYFDYHNSLNNDAITIGGKLLQRWQGRLKISPGRTRYRNGVLYRVVRYRVAHAGQKPDGTENDWLLRVTDRGFRELVPGEGLRHITDIDGNPVDAPVPLLNGVAIDTPTSATVSKLAFLTKKQRDWSNLALPSGFV